MPRILAISLFYTVLTAVSMLAVLPNYDALPPIVSVSDLLNHATAFFVLYILLRCAHAGLSTGTVWGLLTGYALLIEAVQFFLPTRFASLSDVAADAAGVLAASLLLAVLRRRRGCGLAGCTTAEKMV